MPNAAESLEARRSVAQGLKPTAVALTDFYGRGGAQWKSLEGIECGAEWLGFGQRWDTYFQRRRHPERTVPPRSLSRTSATFPRVARRPRTWADWPVQLGQCDRAGARALEEIAPTAGHARKAESGEQGRDDIDVRSRPPRLPRRRVRAPAAEAERAELPDTDSRRGQTRRRVPRALRRVCRRRGRRYPDTDR